MYITVINRKLAQSGEFWKNSVTVPYVVISISSFDELNAVVYPTDYRKDILYIKFDDVSYKTQETYRGYEIEPIPFDEDNAKEILDFVWKHKDKVDNIVVHCEAGISRSPGTAIALSKILNGKENYLSYIQSALPWKFEHANKLVEDLLVQYYQNNLENYSG